MAHRRFAGRVLQTARRMVHIPAGIDRHNRVDEVVRYAPAAVLRLEDAEPRPRACGGLPRATVRRPARSDSAVRRGKMEAVHYEPVGA